ncbi:magnesium transporter MgtE N-terminal domain-containing protein [Nocardia pseudobrasiliensis]|uniref:Mg/Co/Ni transporter MgtE n=1 Tax=Nocardia pseudobrasiliensis TaxID=45979 RepID=A0A370ID95_9NOCA|nr:CBS domain-containing protein [Nocardia pseudobrasiliensis]RDI68580.1 Mg/Co/Ni transporter MgtE [Nocardia pseudobrasiliensis]
MAATRVFAARLAGLVVLGPDGESIGRVRDVLISVRYDRQQPRVLGLLVELPTRKRIFVPILRVTSIEPGAVTLNTGNVSLRRFEQRPGEMLGLAQVLDSKVQVDDPEHADLHGVDLFVVDLGIEQTRTRDWVVSRVAVRGHRRLGRRREVHVVDWIHVRGLTQRELNLPGQDVTQLLGQFEGLRPADVAHLLRELPAKRRIELARALDDERLADVVQELPETDQVEVLQKLGVERAADVLEAMDPDDAADLLGELPTGEAEALLSLMDPEESEPVRRLLEYSPYTAGGLMTPEPVVLTPAATVAEALARVRNPDLTPALASMIFVVRPPTATPTGRYLGCVHLQQLLREPPANLVGGIVDTDLSPLGPDTPLAAVTRYFATYNFVCGPVVDEENHLLGAVTVDDVLDHLLPEDWREHDEEGTDMHAGAHAVNGTGGRP